MSTIQNFRYEVDENNAVRIWDVNAVDNKPFIFQPDYPDTTPFGSKENAETWAVDYINNLLAFYEQQRNTPAVLPEDIVVE